jgi:predicted dienelactone hydrolase
MLTIRLLFVVFVALNAFASVASAITVGTQSIQVVDDSRSRSFTSEIWFEAEPGTKEESFPTLPPLRPIAITVNAKPANMPTRRPLIIISHGNWSTRYGHGTLAIALVKAGYIVLSTSHPGTMNGDLQTAYRMKLWERSRDVSVSLTRLLSDPQWAARIDSNRIGFAGHSFGAWTGVSLAGGRYDINRQLDACKAASVKDQYCETMVKDFLPEYASADSTGSYRDSRIRAFYLMAGGPGAGFLTDTLKEIKAPVLFDTAKFDTILAPEMGSTLLARAIPTAKEIVRDVGHFTYVPLCRPLVGRALAGQICSDPDGVDREALHTAVAADATKFFAAHLGAGGTIGAVGASSEKR